MANIITFLENQQKNGFTHIDRKGNIVKREQIEKQAFKVYNKYITENKVSPLENSFSDYCGQFVESNLTTVSALLDDLYEAFPESAPVTVVEPEPIPKLETSEDVTAPEPTEN